MFADPLVLKLTSFVRSIGIEVQACPIDWQTQFPGLDIRAGAVLVFYPGSFTGWATSLVENFGEGRYLGVPLLQRYGMAVEPRFAAERGVKPYPHMIRWLR